MSRSHTAKKIIFLALICLVTMLPIEAQTTSGTLLGTVRDKSGKGLGEIRIAIKNEENGNLRATRSDDAGNYALFNLPPGMYEITASGPGFQEQAIKNFPIQFNQKNVVKLPLFTLRSASLNGKVVDSQARSLPNAKVQLINEAGLLIDQTFTDRNGQYHFDNLEAGTYLLISTWTGHRAELSGSSKIRIAPQGKDLELLEVLFPNRDARRASDLRTAPGNETAAQFRPAGFAAITTKREAHGRHARATSVSEGSRAAALVNTIDAMRSGNFSEQQLNALPVGAGQSMRSFDEFALLVPGVSPPPYTPGVRGPGVGFGVGTAGQFSVNGMRARANNFSIDGSDNNDSDVGVRRQGFVALVPQSIESIKEISIATLLWDAELGRNFGGQVNAVTRYGGNRFHGQAYGLFTDSRLNARNFFDTQGRRPFTRTQFGGVAGGPIVRDRTHFFVSYEHDQTRASSTQHFSTPLLTERRFAPAFVAQTRLANTVLNAGPFSGVTPLGANVLSLYPLPNNPAGPYGANTFTQTLPADDSAHVLSAKVTHQVRANNFLNARYNFSSDRRTLPSVNRAIRSTLDSRTSSHNLSLILDTSIGPNIFNQARFSYGRTKLSFLEYPANPFVFSSSSNTIVPTSMGPVPVISQTGPIGELLIEPYSPVGIDAFTFPQRRASNTFQYADSLSWSAGKHLFKFGGNVRRYQLNSTLDRLYRPQVFYGGALLTTPNQPPGFLSGVQLASLGVASSVFQTITNGAPNSTIGLRFSEYHAFINDNWRVHPRFSLDLGLRYELNTVPREVNNRIENALALTDLPVPGQSVFDTPSRSYRFQAAVDSYREIVAGRRRIYDADRNNFGPHAGFAWTLDSDSRTVLRSGYGIYYDTVLGAVVSQSRNVFANEIPLNVDPNFLGFDIVSLNNPVFVALTRDANNNPVTPVRLLSPGSCNQFGTCNRLGGAAGDFVALVGQLFTQNDNGGLSFTLPEKRLRTPYAQQWHLTLEREVSKDYLLSAAYVGSKGTKLLRVTTPNRGPNVAPQIPLTSAAPTPVLNLTSAQTGFLLVLPDDATCAGGGGAPVGPPNAGFCTEPDDRPNPFLGAYQIFESSASSNYHALQLEARKRYSRNFQFTAAYTWSHAIDDVSDVFPIAGAPIVAQDSTNLRAERASANFDIRHRFVGSFLWDLPFYRDPNAATAKILKNWQLASIFQAHTGQPFTLNLPVDANLDGNLSDRLSTTNGLLFLSSSGPQQIALAPGRQVTDYFTFGRSGVVGRNTARGANFINLDLALGRTFQFDETKTLLFRAEAFNLLNRPNFGLPIRTLGAPGFGSAVDTIVPARTIVLVIKGSF